MAKSKCMEESRRAKRDRSARPLSPEERIKLALLLGRHLSSVSDAEVPRVVASKLVARERSDVVMLLGRRPYVDLMKVRAVCERFNVAEELDALLPDIKEERALD